MPQPKKEIPVTPDVLPKTTQPVIGPIESRESTTFVGSAMTHLDKASQINELTGDTSQTLADALVDDTEMYAHLQNLKSLFALKLRNSIQHLNIYSGSIKPNMERMVKELDVDFDTVMVSLLNYVNIRENPVVRERILQQKGVARFVFMNAPREDYYGRFGKHDGNAIENNSIYITDDIKNNEYLSFRGVVYHEFIHSLLMPQDIVFSHKIIAKYNWFFEGMTEVLSSYATSTKKDATYGDYRAIVATLFEVNQNAALAFFVTGDDEMYMETLSRTLVFEKGFKPEEAQLLISRIRTAQSDFDSISFDTAKQTVDYLADNLVNVDSKTQEERQQMAIDIISSVQIHGSNSAASNFDWDLFFPLLQSACGEKAHTVYTHFLDMDLRKENFFQVLAADIRGAAASPPDLY